MADSRVQKLYDIIERAGLDGMVLIPGSNLFYITGQDFHLMERPLIVFFVPGRDPVAILPFLEQERFMEIPIKAEMFTWTDTDGYAGAFEAAARSLDLNGKRIGVEELRMRMLESSLIERYFPGVNLVLAGKDLADLRLRKDADDLAGLREAIAISQDALQAVIEWVRPGLTEREITGQLIVEQLKRGGGKHPFEPYALIGPNAALPHADPGDRVLKEGDVLLFDYGTSARGYVSDITRTFIVGEPSPKVIEVYEAVRAANEAGRLVAKPGIAAQEVDRAARKAIEDAGYGKYFTHRTGHGLGLEAHEGPNMVEGNTQILEPGMVFTVEPGIYLPGEFGVRIEDDMVITTDGAESLSTFPRELRRIGV
jgi:Xaa-Pro dipeptidase